MAQKSGLVKVENDINSEVLTQLKFKIDKRWGTGKGIATQILNSRFHEFCIGSVHKDMLLYILSRTLSFGKIFAVIRDSEFIADRPNICPGCGGSRKTLYLAKKELLKKGLIKTIVILAGKKQLGTAYALSPTKILEYSAIDCNKFYKWRQAPLLAIYSVFAPLKHFPSILELNWKSEGGSLKMNAEEAVIKGTEKNKKGKQKRLLKRGKKEAKKQTLISFVNNWLSMTNFPKETWTNKLYGQLKNFIKNDHDGDEDKAIAETELAFERWGALVYSLQRKRKAIDSAPSFHNFYLHRRAIRSELAAGQIAGVSLAGSLGEYKEVKL